MIRKRKCSCQYDEATKKLGTLGVVHNKNCEIKEDRYCVKCGKTSDLIIEEDICYTCAEERDRA